MSVSQSEVKLTSANSYQEPEIAAGIEINTERERETKRAQKYLNKSLKWVKGFVQCSKP